MIPHPFPRDDGHRRRPRNLAGRAALIISIIGVVLSMTGAANAAKRAVVTMVDGHPLTTTDKAHGIPVLSKKGKLSAAVIPAGATAKCPSATVNLGTWCLDTQPYALTPAETEEGVNNYAWATRACTKLGGFLPSAAQLIGAANRVKLESTITDNPATALVNDTNQVTYTIAVDENEMTSTLVTTEAGSDAAGSEGISVGATGATEGAPDPTPEPAVPFPPTLQYVTVYDNHNEGGFSGSQPVTTPDNFRCGFYLK